VIISIDVFIFFLYISLKKAASQKKMTAKLKRIRIINDPDRNHNQQYTIRPTFQTFGLWNFQ